MAGGASVLAAMVVPATVSSAVRAIATLHAEHTVSKIVVLTVTTSLRFAASVEKVADMVPEDTAVLMDDTAAEPIASLSSAILKFI